MEKELLLAKMDEQQRLKESIREMQAAEKNLRIEEIPIPAGFIPKPIGSLKLRSANYVLLAARERNGN